jgi:hypothetical protein
MASQTSNITLERVQSFGLVSSFPLGGADLSANGGGIVGSSTGSFGFGGSYLIQVEDSLSAMTVSAVHAGGIVGEASQIKLSGTVSSGSVSASSSSSTYPASAGGLVGNGIDELNLSDSYSLSSVSASNSSGVVGGLMGTSTQPSTNQVTQISRSYAKASLSVSDSSNGKVGGLVGRLIKGVLNVSESFSVMSVLGGAPQSALIVGMMDMVGETDPSKLLYKHYTYGYERTGSVTSCYNYSGENDVTVVSVDDCLFDSDVHREKVFMKGSQYYDYDSAGLWLDTNGPWFFFDSGYLYPVLKWQLQAGLAPDSNGNLPSSPKIAWSIGPIAIP